MNTKNNKRRKESQRALGKAFIELLQTKEIGQVTVTELCQMTGLNRSTFYANFDDVYALADALRDELEKEVAALSEGGMFNKASHSDYLALFQHISDNQMFYRTYFKLGYDREHLVRLGDIDPAHRIFPDGQIEYHIEFFRAGLNAMIGRWLMGGCKESPEEMAQILKQEYLGRQIIPSEPQKA